MCRAYCISRHVGYVFIVGHTVRVYYESADEQQRSSDVGHTVFQGM